MTPVFFVQFDHIVVLIAYGARKIQARGSDCDTQNFGRALGQRGGAHVDLGPVLDDIKFARHQVSHRLVQRKAEKVGAALGPDMDFIDQHGAPVHRTRPVDDKYRIPHRAAQMDALPGRRGDLLGCQNRGAGNPALLGDAFGEAGIGGRIIAHARRRNEPSAPFFAKDQALGLKLQQGAARGYSGDRKFLGQNPFGRQPVAGLQGAGLDHGFKMVADPHVIWHLAVPRTAHVICYRPTVFFWYSPRLIHGATV